MLGSITLSLALASALVSLGIYIFSLGRRDPQQLGRYLAIGRAAFHTTVVSFMVASATLMYLIFSHEFQYTYIFQHSSQNLSKPLLFASFYAGQEGSFMLWTLMTCLIGVVVYGYSRKVNYEREVMAPLMLVMSCLLLILIVKSPFRTIFQSFPEKNLAANFIPKPRGLNPTLENLWITIHPPILFMGFAAMTVPFVFAVAGLLKKDYQRWITISLPWALFASMVLGFGVMLGGWWAYETLGWGGFWAWDPVENSSLIPWLACVALVHSMLVQRRTGSLPTAQGDPGKVGGLVKTNFFLAVTCFGLILYSTFLTRSGVLGDTSVHSFVSPGGFVYAVLLAIIIIFLGLGFGLIAKRWSDLRRSAHNFHVTSRETALGLGSAILLASAMVVLIGTSWPLFMPMFGLPKIAVPIDFYNNLQIPIALALVVVNALSMRLKWKQTDMAVWMRQMVWATLIAFAGTIALIVYGIRDPIYVALGFGSVLAMVVNIQVGAKVIRGNPRFIGAYVSHAGIALLMLGIIFTSRYSQTEHVKLVQGVPSKVFEYSIVYTGSERVDIEKTDRERYQHNIVMTKNGTEHKLGPITFVSDFNNRESAFLEPDILYRPTEDIYVSPKALDEEGGDPRATLHKGEKAVVPFDSSISVRFEKFDMSRASSNGQQGAVMQVKQGDSVWFLTSYYTMGDGTYLPATIPGTDITIGMGGLNADKENLSNSEAILVFASKSHPPGPTRMTIALDVSVKPFISFVWAGVVIMVGGFFFSILRRRREVDRVIAVAPREPSTSTD
jgi:cytochrome c-type biogenesis protein CcmF